MDKRAFKGYERELYMREWDRIVSLLKRSEADLSKIKIVVDIRKARK